MEISALNQLLGNMDLYLLDQVLKGRFHKDMTVLDAGCGEGRNLHYFLKSGYRVFGVDANPNAIRLIRFVAKSMRHELDTEKHFQCSDITEMDWKDQTFDLIICAAVLHFAQNEGHFKAMWQKLSQYLKPGGVLFVRMAWQESSSGVLSPFPFCLNQELMKEIHQDPSWQWLEPFKRVVVEDKRSMATLVLKKLA